MGPAVPGRTAGCTLRPIRASSGRNEFAEILLDETPVPADRVIGGLDRGWDVAMTRAALRVGVAGLPGGTRRFGSASRVLGLEARDGVT